MVLIETQFLKDLPQLRLKQLINRSDRAAQYLSKQVQGLAHYISTKMA